MRRADRATETGWIAAIVAGSTLFASVASAQHAYFDIHVVDDAGAPVPGVTLRTVHELRFVSDGTGHVAFYEPGLMDTEVWFYVEAPHAEVAADGFGYEGVRLAVREGERVEVVVSRTGAAPDGLGDRETRRIARGVPDPAGWFSIHVADAETRRGVPLVDVQLSTERDDPGDHLVSDSAGYVAIDPLDLEGATIAATLHAHGYTFANEGRVDLAVTAGASVEIEATRMNHAERLYRVTGGGIYRDSVLLGREVPLAAPVIDGLVLGQDSVFTAEHRGALFWVFGDTNRVAYPLGQFLTSGATSVLPTDGGLDPELGVDLTYFVDEAGFSRPMAPRETVPGEGVVWSSGLVSVPDAAGDARLFALFGMFASLSERTRFGLLRYDDATARFEEVVTFDGPDARYPRENAFLVDHADGTYVYYHDSVRIPARAEALLDPSTYEAFTPFEDAGATTIERDERGHARYRFRAGGIRHPVPGDELGADALIEHVVDTETGAAIHVHENGSTEWNDYTGRYLRLLMNRRDLGEIWLALADTPMGPWVAAERVVRHDAYTFYNPRQHPMFDADHGRRIYFEGTYTSSFSAAPRRTPRYDYNQIMYALSLDRAPLAVPVSIYESARGELGPHEVLAPGDPPTVARFLAPVRERPGTEPVYWSGPDCEPRRLLMGGDPTTPPLFYARRGDPAGAHQRRLYEVWTEEGVSPRYTVEPSGNAHAFAVVWTNPIEVALPAADYRRGPFADAGPDRCLAEGETFDVPAGTWRLDGEPVEAGTLAPSPGLHVLTRIETAADGRAVEDHALVRVGESPALPPVPSAGCGCRTGGRQAVVPPVLLAVLLGTWLIRRAARR